MPNLLGILKSQWKKIAAVGVSAYACDYAARRYRTVQNRAILQTKADAIGQQPLAVDAPLRKVIVLVDTATASRKALQLYNSDVGPILNLAGLAVDVVESHQRGQARDTARQMELAGIEGVVVVGNDGTLQDFVTGWMRRDDASQVSKTVPVAMVPVEPFSTVNTALRGPDPSTAHAMGTAALSVANGNTRQVDVLQVTNAEGKRVYAMGYLLWGLPAALVARTFNPYSKFSRARAKWGMLKDSLLNPASQQYRAQLSVADGTPSECEFAGLVVTSTSRCGAAVVDPERSIDDGQVTVTSVPGPLPPWAMYTASRKLTKGSELTAVFGSSTEHKQAANKITVVPLSDQKSQKPAASEDVENKDSSSTVPDAVPLIIDGQTFESFPATVEVLRSALVMYA